ncbi:MAG: addiction module toxin RelE [Candidatus Altiarchaeota archaeon]
MREFEIKPPLHKILKKLLKKNKTTYEAVMGKIFEVVDSPNIEHYKNLRYDMKDKKRVHLAGSYVLVFSYDKSRDFVSFLDYEHHDKIYKR